MQNVRMFANMAWSAKAWVFRASRPAQTARKCVTVAAFYNWCFCRKNDVLTGLPSVEKARRKMRGNMLHTVSMATLPVLATILANEMEMRCVNLPELQRQKVSVLL